MKSNKSAFTMIELVFVIVILGILASVAIPRLAATRNDALITKGRANVLAIRSGIITERQGRMFRGDNDYINKLDGQSATPGAGDKIFDNNGTATNRIMQSGVTTKTGSGGWLKTAANTYTFTVGTSVYTFTYTSGTGTFTCTGATGSGNCTDLVN